MIEAFLDRTITADYSTKQSRQAVVDDLNKLVYSKGKGSLGSLLDNLEECAPKEFAPEKDAGFRAAQGQAMLGLYVKDTVKAFLEVKDIGKSKSTSLLAMTYLSFYILFEVTYKGLKAIPPKEKGIKTSLKPDDYQAIVKVYKEGAPSAKDLETLKPMIEAVRKEIEVVEAEISQKEKLEQIVAT
jgi:hypothetical protein